MSKPKLIVFASGSKNGGGSGFQELVENSLSGILQAVIIAVVSNYKKGGVRQRAEKFNIPFIRFPGTRTAEEYQRIIKNTGAEWIALSGWLKLAKGLDPCKTINIHPGPLPKFGGQGMYGHYVHEAVINAYQAGEIKFSAVTMHFVTDEYDRGPVFFQYPVIIRDDDTAESLAARVNKIEHSWQSFITNLVVTQQISWDGKNHESLKVPDWYYFHKPF
jgi:phosphoribosylglycinamide formyltransferase-1